MVAFCRLSEPSSVMMGAKTSVSIGGEVFFAAASFAQVVEVKNATAQTARRHDLNPKFLFSMDNSFHSPSCKRL